LKRLFLEEKWGNVVWTTRSFATELFESLKDNMRIEINTAAARWSCLTDVAQAIIKLFAGRRHCAAVISSEYRGKITIESFSFEMRVASNLVIGKFDGSYVSSGIEFAIAVMVEFP